ncbi:hypothetical protein EWM64_g3015 [Hericium alpestre]|uniref:Uncharacterized protein n=1 Tax=Hericium alpestre TaxID=135208 RepID=A0A4Z0A1N3_9AGAM|nr:hypothetical protein EWM64_g3015 [Hericium alpestre]
MSSSQAQPRTEYDRLRRASEDDAETSSLPPLPEIPPPELDLTISLDSILGATSSSAEGSDKVQKRASNVLKLAEENEKLKQELRAMSDRLEAAERRRAELDRRNHQGKAEGTPSAR